MITAAPVELPPERIHRLSDWLAKTECDTMLAVITSESQKEIALAMREALLSDDSPAKIETSNCHLRRAQEFSKAAKIISDMRSQKTFHVVKLS